MKETENMTELLMEYGKLIREAEESARTLHAVWDDDAGDVFYVGSLNLIEDMRNDIERIKEWLG